MKKQLSHIAPLRAGVVTGVASITFMLICGLFVLIITLLGVHISVPTGFFLLIDFLFGPVFYAIAGFIGGLIGAAIYNLVAKWSGGLEFEFRDLEPASV